MESNLLLEQYGKFKKAELEESPFRCLLDTNIEINPHQINAFCAAIQALKTGGIVLADEVGLGKTIEAGLTLKYVLDSGAKRVLIALPATLRKQWEIELEEKFGLESTILDRFTVESEPTGWKTWLEDKSKVRIVLASYDYSSKLMKRFPNVKWDFIIIDEAHNLRNVFHGTKRAKRLYDLSQGIPKILLTATPLQNTLSDLHGLISFIDPRIFGSEKVFNKRFIEGEDYAELKRELIPVLYRTLRRDVGKYMDFKKRECRTIDFVLSPDEVELYMRVNNFLKRDALYSIPNANKGLIVLVIRKLLASSSYALIETFEVLKRRLEKLYEGTKSANAQDGFDLFWEFVEDEIDESGFEEIDDEDTAFQKQQIQAEIDEVIVAHDHYRELVDEIKNSDIFRYRDLDKSVVEPSDTVDISSPVDEDQLTIFDFAVTDAGVKSFSEINTNTKTQQELYEAYLKAFGSGKKQEQTPSDMQQLTMEQIFGTEAGNAATKPDEITHDSPVDGKGKKPLSKDEFVQKIKEYSGKAISVPKILVQTTSEVKFNRFEVKRNIPDFEVAMAKIERFDAINQQLLTAVDAQILEVDDALNTLACMLLDSISELSYEDADFIIDVVDQYLAQIDGNEEDKRKIVRRYASLIVSDIRKQIFEHTERKTEDIHIVQKDLILFRKFVKNVKKDGRVRFDKPFTDKANIKKYLFTGYKKAYYTENAFDSDPERLFSIILEEDPDVIRWIKPPLNQLGLFWQAGQQYNPDFLVETTSGKFMVEVKASNEVTADEVVAKAREGIKWCHFASTADPDHKVWEYRLISDDNIKLGNTCKYTLGTAHKIKEG